MKTPQPASGEALALAEAKEREELLTLIEQHKVVYSRCDSFSMDTRHGADDDPEFEALSDQELELLNAVVEFPVASICNMILKGRYLATVQAVGGLCFEQAEAFVETFLQFVPYEPVDKSNNGEN